MSDDQGQEPEQTLKVACEFCGQPFAPGKSMAAHIRFKHPAVEAPEIPVAAAGPVKLPSLHRAAGPELARAVRDPKLLRPQCAICAPEVEAAGYGWWNRCSHDPYVGERGFPVTEIEYDDEVDASGIVVGRVIRDGYPRDRHVLRPWPNITGVALMPRLNSGNGVQWKTLLYGFIRPEELSSKSFPNGIAPMCEFFNCYWQEDLTNYDEVGTYCQEGEAVQVYESLHGTVTEVNNAEIRADQLAVSRMKLKAGMG